MITALWIALAACSVAGAIATVLLGQIYEAKIRSIADQTVKAMHTADDVHAILVEVHKLTDLYSQERGTRGPRECAKASRGRHRLR
ncbi:hypothetical protein [Actinocrispum wychmicini]|uniref:Uncharacterized protein n=1 Tax=Actinocrispum wychmicini TaxID=1213861 RepID=A0A4R2JYD8_9PSEU|nr:hypothetical protein [Actinocrispum wychmicini]TCO65623.1 hypothetical protein EV192_1011415 [Actinocrispum wychmicini]